MKMDKKIKNRFYPSIEGGRIMRVITKDEEYYDVLISGGTPMGTRMDIAQYAHVLSGYYEGRNEKDQKLKVDRIILCNCKDGELCTINGEGPVGHSWWKNKRKKTWVYHYIDKDTLGVAKEELFEVRETPLYK